MFFFNPFGDLPPAKGQSGQDFLTQFWATFQLFSPATGQSGFRLLEQPLFSAVGTDAVQLWNHLRVGKSIFEKESQSSRPWSGAEPSKTKVVSNVRTKPYLIVGARNVGTENTISQFSAPKGGKKTHCCCRRTIQTFGHGIIPPTVGQSNNPAVAGTGHVAGFNVPQWYLRKSSWHIW